LIVWLHWNGGGGTLLHKVLIKDEEKNKIGWNIKCMCSSPLCTQKLGNKQEDVCGRWDTFFDCYWIIYNV